MKKISFSLIALAALAASNIAAAQVATPFYAGLQVGTSRSNLDCTGATDCKKNDTGIKVYGGYKFTPEWAAELSYTDFGKIRGTDSGITAEWKTSSVGLGVAYHATFTPEWSGLARFGVASNEAKVSASSGGLSGSDSQRKTKPYLGLGVGYALTKQATLTGNWDWTESEVSGGGETAKLKHNLFSVGVAFSF